MSKIAMLAHFLRQKMAIALPMMQIIYSNSQKSSQ